MAQDGVEDGEELARDSYDSDDLRLAGGDQASTEGLEDGVVAAGDEGSHEEGGAHALAAAGNHALALPLAGLAHEGGETGKRGDLSAPERSQLRHLGDESARGDRADAWNGGEQVFALAPHWRAPDAGIDFGIDLAQFLLQGGEQPVDGAQQAAPR